MCVCVLADVSAFLMDSGYVQWVCGSRLEQWMRERMLSLSLAFSRDKLIRVASEGRGCRNERGMRVLTLLSSAVLSLFTPFH